MLVPERAHVLYIVGACDRRFEVCCEDFFVFGTRALVCKLSKTRKIALGIDNVVFFHGELRGRKKTNDCLGQQDLRKPSMSTKDTARFCVP